MGGGSYSKSAYADYATNTRGISRDDRFAQSKSRSIHKNLNPRGVGIRESRDSDEHPMSTPIIIGLDVTGSMGVIAENIAAEGLGKLMNNILESLPVTDPQIMFMGIGDAACDNAPLQVSQFESDNRMVDQLTQIWLEGGGGGNDSESYELPWHFAAYHKQNKIANYHVKVVWFFGLGLPIPKT